MNDLDPILEHARRSDQGAILIGYIQRPDEDAWDAVVVGKDLQPLTFWATNGGEMGGDEQIRDEAGNVLMVVSATPPGAEPAGLIAVPSDERGSPLGRLVSIVSGDALTMLDDVSREPKRGKGQKPGLHESLSSLIRQAAAGTSEGNYVTEIEAADGAPITVLMNWGGAPLLFWTQSPDDPHQLALTLVAALPEGGLAGVTVDNDLRPVHSGAAIQQMLRSSR